VNGRALTRFEGVDCKGRRDAFSEEGDGTVNALLRTQDSSSLMVLRLALGMAGAIFMVHLPNGLFMNWFGKRAGEGFEYHLLAIGIALALLLGGGGRASIDRAIAESNR
jgi:hypothetical protein